MRRNAYWPRLLVDADIGDAIADRVGRGQRPRLQAASSKTIPRLTWGHRRGISPGLAAARERRSGRQLPLRIRSKNSLLFFVFCILSSMNSIASISSIE